MRVAYDVLDPTGNITILVRTPVPEEKQPAIASHLMELEPAAEQVGFLSQAEDCDIALRMAGGEFCGNASMCAGVVAALEAGRNKSNVSLKVSGATGIVCAEVEQAQETETDGETQNICGTIWAGIVDMPLPVAIEEVNLPGTGPLPVVCFEGISHVILEQSLPKERAEELAPIWCRELKADALGLMFLSQDKEKSASLKPLVYVPAAGTLFWESSCASGTTAVCAWMTAKEQKPCSIRLKQPGGTLGAQSDADGRIRLTGTIRLCKQASAEIYL